MLGEVREDSRVAGLRSDSDLSQELSSATVFIGIARGFEVGVVREQETLRAIRTDRVVDQPLPHRIGIAAV